MYNQMAQILMGHDATGAIRQFDEDGDLSAGGKKLKEVFFFNFARLLNKDEINEIEEIKITNKRKLVLNFLFQTVK